MAADEHRCAAAGDGKIRHLRLLCNSVAPVGCYAVICSGQVKTDTTLSRLDNFFVCIRADIPERRMFTPTVVAHLDRVDDVITGLLARPIRALRRALALEAAKKSLRDCIVSTIPFSAHAACNTMVSHDLSVGMAGVLRTTITMVYQAGCRLAAAKRHLQRVSHQLGIHMIAHRPPHHLA